MHPDRPAFLQFSAELTGYSGAALEGTGLVDEHLALVEKHAGPRISARLHAAARRVLRHKSDKARERAMRIDVLASPLLWPLCAALIELWYTGSWTSMSASWYSLAGESPPEGVTPGKSCVPSAQAYEQQLAFHAAGAHPPGAKPTGYGSWSLPPVFGDDVAGDGTRGREAE